MIQNKVFIGDNEEELIKNVYEFMKDFEDHTLAGFKINTFDNLQMLFKFIKYDVPPFRFLPTRYESLDCYEVLNGFTSNAKGTLDQYLKAFGIGEKYNGYNGASVQGLWENNEWEEIEKYVKGDSDLEHRLALKVAGFMNKSINLEKILTYDIEVVASDIMSIEEAFAIHKQKVLSDKRLKSPSTIQAKIDEFDYASQVEDLKKDAIFDKFRNKIIAVSFTWGIDDEEVGF